MKKATYRLTLIAAVASLFLFDAGLFASETDERIESSANASYVFKTFLKGDDINIQSTDGTVTLTGVVSEESRRGLANETVAGLPGVKRVENKLEVKSDVPAVHSDAWLITKVKSTLLFHRNVNATGTDVLARDGTVILRGEATSGAQKDLTTEYAKDVEGVKTVKNEMTILTTEMKPNKKTMGEKRDVISEPIDDASITALVKTTLLYHRSTNSLNTSVETKEGVVTLGGNAKDAAEKDLATKLVSDVDGVKRVVNDMAVR